MHNGWKQGLGKNSRRQASSEALRERIAGFPNRRVGVPWDDGRMKVQRGRCAVDAPRSLTKAWRRVSVKSHQAHAGFMAGSQYSSSRNTAVRFRSASVKTQRSNPSLMT